MGAANESSRFWAEVHVQILARARPKMKPLDKERSQNYPGKSLDPPCEARARSGNLQTWFQQAVHLDWVLSPKVNSECILNLEICSKIHWILKNFIIRHRTSQFRKTTQYQWDFTFSQLFRKMISFGRQNRGPDASRYYSLIPKS